MDAAAQNTNNTTTRSILLAKKLTEQAKNELFETVKAFHVCKQDEGQSDYDQFVQNYNMHRMGKTIAELHAMLKLHEKGIPKKAETYGRVRSRRKRKNRDGQRLTPPYTTQHNGVSESRNQTLLDMVRSMMNLTTLPKSFWGYPLEFATRILNMVPTKKVERMTYEIWHGVNTNNV
uniref:Zinc finger, CCHC-type n=1 Tax=Tanacetum cinerariifolium TaxID=118510 RepID=A0A699HK42_TANCI|nr:zinc finger, CCHC-type [Tanacetum cinerariifolium]